MTVRMLGQKWNQVRAAGMDINDGNPERIENWFFAVWAYNTGFYPNDGGPWGRWLVQQSHQPHLPANRPPFLDSSSADAAHPPGLAIPPRR